MPITVKDVQAHFGWAPYAGPANKANAPAGYYLLRNAVKEWCHYNGYFNTDIMVQGGQWDAIVARVIADPNFPAVPGGVLPLFPRPAHPNPWSGQQCLLMVAFIRELCKVS